MHPENMCLASQKGVECSYIHINIYLFFTFYIKNMYSLLSLGGKGVMG